MAPNPLTAQIERIKAALAREHKESPPLPPPPDAPYHFELVKVEPPERGSKDRPGVDDVRTMMREEMAAYLRNPTPDHMLLIRATPGVGKTTAAAWAAWEAAKVGKRVQYAGPRHAFYNDLMRALDHWGCGAEYAWEWLPRQDGDEGRILHGPKRQTCFHTDSINAWMRKGYRGIDFCSGVCGWDMVNGGCEYHAQKGRKEPIVFCQHAHVVLGHPLEFHVTIGDENPMSAFAHIRSIKASDIIGNCEYGNFHQLLDTLKALTEQEPRYGANMIQALMTQSGFSLSELLKICKSASMPLDATPLGMKPPRSPDEALNAPVWYTPDLIFLLLRELKALSEQRPQIERIRTGYGQLDLYMRRSPTERLPPHVIWLDATGDERIYSALFGRKVKLIRAEPALKGRIFQVWNRANGKSSLFEKDDGGNIETTNRSAQAGQIIERVISDYGYQSPAVITFKDLVGKLEITQRVEQGHFYAARGSNAFENCDAIFIIGAPLPPLGNMLRTAGVLFFERDLAFNERWTRQNTRYNYTDENGDGWAYPVGNFWADPDLATVVKAYREEEIIHAAHRVRPVFQETDVWLLTNIPIDDLPPTKLLSANDIMGAPDNANAFQFNAVMNEIEGWKDDVVTTAMLVERLRLNRRTASKYVQHLAMMDGWEAAAIRTGQRGPLTKGARKKHVY